ncbi:MAG: VOC family protein [Ktedonobacterales bacterium]|nr:VOC family protein [Ktedonobacterales bacterium]
MHLGSIIISTADKERMKRFYHDVLGIPFNATGKLESQGVIIHPAFHQAIHGAPPEPHRIMLTFDVGDIHHTATLLQQQGVIFIRQPEQEWWGGWLATFRDPDGNYLQLLQPAEQEVAEDGAKQAEETAPLGEDTAQHAERDSAMGAGATA